MGRGSVEEQYDTIKLKSIKMLAESDPGDSSSWVHTTENIIALHCETNDLYQEIEFSFPRVYLGLIIL